MIRKLGIVALIFLHAAAAHAEPAPGGSYLQTCHNIQRSGNFVSARCASERWGDKNTQIDLRRCARNHTGLSNLNGGLVCEGPLPPGSYLKTCHAVFIMDNRLQASCKTEGGAGDYRSNSIVFKGCNQGFRNADGRLVCGQ
ncbi:CVNH domain-containing protein [Collimonas sp. PA-H2]|uniref:CVNH domain-containing protein n=1 Tax=Collimonas sp. PA-H2 TaxID=1881062 RepID=UPI0035194378